MIHRRRLSAVLRVVCRVGSDYATPSYKPTPNHPVEKINTFWPQNDRSPTHKSETRSIPSPHVLDDP